MWVFNIGGNVRFTINETMTRVYDKVSEMGCFAGFLTGREAAHYMKLCGHGTILFTILPRPTGSCTARNPHHGLRKLISERGLSRTREG
ncbi:MAG: hypothetical protein Ct9H300mP16_02960 [Pseudomonadota bacterium]|nr:MAG: hypothetical protein Ct9H300mP16_02960 [Pseudomonadota bacterium]